MKSTEDIQIKVSNIESTRLVNKPHAIYQVVYDGKEEFRIVLLQKLLPNKASSKHLHAKVPELVIVLRGVLCIQTKETKVKVPPGHVAYIPPGVAHSMINEDPFEEAISIILLGAKYRKEDVKYLG